MEEVKLHPDRFPENKNQRSDEVVDRWLADHFRGPHHLRAMTDQFEYIKNAAAELKRRLREGE